MSVVRRVLQRQIMPLDRDTDVFALYVDLDPALLDADKYEVGSNRSAQELNNAAIRQSTSSGNQLHPDQIIDRCGLRLEPSQKLSLGTYFNGFPAGYWRRWTVVTEVRLTVSLKGRGAMVTVYKSMANGRSQRVEMASNHDLEQADHVFDLSLQPFTDGGWYWYDVVAGDEAAEVSAIWDAEVPADRAEHGTVDLGIVTMNRPDFCSKLLVQLGEAPELREYLDEVLVMDQGSTAVTTSEHFATAQSFLGDKLRLITQGNLGGSGGYARGQMESVRKGTATYFLCMDDDVVCEPESVIRAVTFGDLARRPIIVGGHMFSLYARSRLHSYGEIVQPYKFWWMSAPGVYPDWDFAARNLRSSRWLHRRIDVDFNGWFMCLIPRETLERIGLSLPLFIKWDDSEFGLRAKAAGVRTVSFPGAAVWHIPWTDKNDALDWQAYFHQRNRIVAALLHSPYPRGGALLRESFSHQIKHLVSMQYSTVELRHMALEDVLAGPEALHGDLEGKLPAVNAFRKQFTDAQLSSDPEAFPEIRRHKPPRGGKTDEIVPGRLTRLMTAALAPLRQVQKPRPLSRQHPEAEVPAMDAKWYVINKYDSAVVSMPDGNSAALYQRDPERYRELLRKSIDIHKRFYSEWDDLAARYRAALGEVTSPDAWAATFEPWMTPSTPEVSNEVGAEEVSRDS